MLHRLLRRALPAAAVAAAVAAAPARADHPMVLLAQTPSGGQPNAPATDPAISGDGRYNRYAAFTSAATDIVTGSGPTRNVFLVTRKPPYDKHADQHWDPGTVTLASQGLGGQPANGDSWGATFDGYDYSHAGRDVVVGTKCMAFVSAASNLVPGDTDGQADVFLRKLSTGRLTRISAPGPVTEVALDGRCWTIAYIAGGTVYTKQIRYGSGKVRRVSAPGGASSVDLSASGKVVTYSRNGVVYVNRDGRTRKIAAGTDPSADQFGLDVAFSRGTQLWQASLTGAARPHRLATLIHRRDGLKLMDGTSPSMTTGGHFVFFVNGPLADSNVYERFDSCPGGATAQQIVGSVHGNYAAFSCSSGALYMAYIGSESGK